MTNLISKILFPHRFQQIGWLILVPFALFAYLTAFHEFTFDFLDLGPTSISDAFKGSDKNLTNELAILGLFTSFSADTIPSK